MFSAIAALLSACTLAPKEAAAEKARAAAAGQAYEAPAEQRVLPELSADPTWQEILHRAFLANGELEATYWDWRAALARIDQAAAYPSSNLQIGFEYMFSAERMKSWDRTTISAGFDPAKPLMFPTKVVAAGKVATEQARAAGLRFEAAKFELQRRVLTAWLDYALMAEKVRIQRDQVGLLKMLSDLAAERVKAGAPQQDLLKAQMEHRLAENELAGMEAELGRMRAMLNGMLARPAGAPLAVPRALPAARPLPPDDAVVLALGVDRNPELAGLARDVAGKKEALELARQAWIPDIQPMASFTGTVSQVVGAMVMLPLAAPLIRGQIDETRAMMRGAEASLQQARRERAAAYVGALYLLRNAEHQVQVYSETILPKAQQVLRSSREAYAAGRVTFIELVDAQRTLLEVRRLIAEMRTEREKQLATLEALAGVDVETLVNHEGTKAPR